MGLSRFGVTGGSYRVPAVTSHTDAGRVTIEKWRIDVYGSHNAMSLNVVLGTRQGNNERMVRFNHVPKIYDRGMYPALDDINIKINCDKFILLVGASKSDKLIFLKLVIRGERSTKGCIHVLGHDLPEISS